MREEHEGSWKIGELAQHTGLSVRALHHYDQIGLVRPSHRTSAGHRRYTARRASACTRCSLCATWSCRSRTSVR